MPRKPQTNVPVARDNALARQALDAIRLIDTEAHEKKLPQLELLKSAKAAILERVNELNHQLAQIDKAMMAITGRSAPTREKGARRNLQEVKERVAQWMEGHKGQKFNAGDLVTEFPDLHGVSISMLLKPQVESGKVKIDASDGAKRLKYFMPEG